MIEPGFVTCTVAVNSTRTFSNTLLPSRDFQCVLLSAVSSAALNPSEWEKRTCTRFGGVHFPVTGRGFGLCAAMRFLLVWEPRRYLAARALTTPRRRAIAATFPFCS